MGVASRVSTSCFSPAHVSSQNENNALQYTHNACVSVCVCVFIERHPSDSLSLSLSFSLSQVVKQLGKKKIVPNDLREETGVSLCEGEDNRDPKGIWSRIFNVVTQSSIYSVVQCIVQCSTIVSLLNGVVWAQCLRSALFTIYILPDSTSIALSDLCSSGLFKNLSKTPRCVHCEFSHFYERHYNAPTVFAKTILYI